MRLAVPAPVAPRKCAVTVRVHGEPNVSSVHIVPTDSQVQNGADISGPSTPERSYASAQCQTEDPTRYIRRTLRRTRAVSHRPDILDVQIPPPPPPPYATLLSAGPPLPLPSTTLPLPGTIPAHPVHRFPFQPIPVRRSGRSAAYACSEGGGSAPKSCCGLGSRRPPLRWFVILVGVAGVCCIAAGAVLGAIRPSPRAHNLTLLLLMLGVGVILLSVAGLSWRLSGRDSPPCRVLLGLRREDSNGCGRRLVPRLPPTYGRPHHPYAAMLYPEFQYRPPPPSYQASMQEYRLRLLLMDRSAPMLSPPPSYRSNNTSLVRGASALGWCGSEYSGPPSYRGRQPPLPPPPDPDKMAAADDKSENLVTVVNTEPPAAVIVTVSGSPALEERTQHHHVSEIDILAHL